MPRPDVLAAGIDVVGQLSIAADDTPLRVEFRGDLIEVVLPDLSSALRLSKKLTRGHRRIWVRSVQSLLVRSGLELRILVGRHAVGRLTTTSRGNWLASCLGVSPMILSPRVVLPLLFGRLPRSVARSSVTGATSEPK